jgi:hypothetical protein
LWPGTEGITSEIHRVLCAPRRAGLGKLPMNADRVIDLLEQAFAAVEESEAQERGKLVWSSACG